MSLDKVSLNYTEHCECVHICVYTRVCVCVRACAFSTLTFAHNKVIDTASTESE